MMLTKSASLLRHSGARRQPNGFNHWDEAAGGVQKIEHVCESTGIGIAVKHVLQCVPRHQGSIFSNGFRQNVAMEEHGDKERRLFNRGRRAAHVLFAAGLLAMSSPAAAEGWEFGGHLKYQYSSTDFQSGDVAALFGDDPARDHAFDGRIKAEWRKHGWDFAAHYEVLALNGDSRETRRAMTAGLLAPGSASGLPDDRKRLFDLSDDFVDQSRTAAVHRLDRLSLGYTADKATLRLGRQAMSWGNGLAFQVFDFVNPFSPIAIDKDYKTGEDMLYGQWQWMDQGDLQLLLLPRRDPLTHKLDREQASQALKLHARAAGFDVDAMLARHYDQTLLGIGMVRSIGGAVWRLDVLHTEVPRRDGVWSLVTNLDYSWTLFGKNVYSFVEYFRNGFGVYREADYLAMDPQLTARVARGELYALGRDYLVLGVQIEAWPLFNMFVTLLQNLNDASRLVQLRGVYDWRQNLQVMAGANLPAGERGSEYGGLPVAPGGPYLAAGSSVYARVGYYF